MWDQHFSNAMDKPINVMIDEGEMSSSLCGSPSGIGGEPELRIPYHLIPPPASSRVDASVISEGDLPVDVVESKRRNKLLYLYIILFLVFSVIAAVCRKLVYNAFGTRYTFFRQQLTNLLYDLYASTVVIYKLMYTKDITPVMRKYPIWKFCAIAFLDGFADFLGSVGGVGTPGSWAVLLQQLTIPFTLVIAYFVLHQRFGSWQLFGAFTIVGGTVLAITPLFTNNGKSHHAVWYSVIIYACSQIPASMSGVFKEVAFKAAVLDVFYLTAMVSWTQLFISWVFVPILSLESFGGIPLDEIPSVFQDGFRCFMGDESIPVHREGMIDGHCSSYVPRVTMMFSVSGFFSGIFQLLILKNGSASLMVLCQAIGIPIANMAFTIRAVMGSQVEPFSWYDIGGLAMVVLGFVIYRRATNPSSERMECMSPSSSEGEPAQMMYPPVMDLSSGSSDSSPDSGGKRHRAEGFETPLLQEGVPAKYS